MTDQAPADDTLSSICHRGQPRPPFRPGHALFQRLPDYARRREITSV